MKKLLAMLLALAMMLGCIAFGEGVDYTGTWVLTGAESAGVQIDVSMFALIGLDMNMTMTLNADGTMTMVMMGIEEAGTWAVTENGIAITDEEETLEIAYQNEMLLMEQAGTVLMLTREGAAPAVASALQADPDAANYDYVGMWVLSSVEVAGITMDAAAMNVDGSMELYEDGICVMTSMGEMQEGKWAATETGIVTVDADAAVEYYTLVNGTLVVEQDGMRLYFEQMAFALPLAGLTAADFNGDWVFTYAEYMGELLDAETLGMTVDLHIADGTGHVDMVFADGTESYDAVCETEEIDGLGTVLYFLYTDPATGEATEYGLILLLYEDGELVWLASDEQGNDIYYCFLNAEELAAE